MINAITFYITKPSKQDVLEAACTVLDCFDMLLDKHDIQIGELENEENGARLYGEDYYNMEDNIMMILDMLLINKDSFPAHARCGLEFMI